MTERTQLLLLQIVGAAVAVGIAIGAAVLASQGYAVPAVLVSSVVSALMAKLFGEPLQAVTLRQVSNMPPPMAAAVAKRAIDSLPPEQRDQLSAAGVVLQGLSEPPPPPTRESIQVDPSKGAITGFTTIDIPKAPPRSEESER
jgi:hypothetical protein